MSGYRRGAVLGLTIAETFILLTFLLLIALLGLVQQDEPLPEPDTASAPRVWMRPEEIETLVNAAEEARKAQEEAEQVRAAVELERDQAHEKAEEARKAQEEAEQARAAVELERDQAHEKAEEARKAQEEAEQARAAVELERDQAHEKAEEARKAQAEAEQVRAAVELELDQAHENAVQARAAAERERDLAQRDLALLRRKGKNPPCWYQIVSAGEGTREKPYYLFNAAIYENYIELAPRTAPPGAAFDDGGGPYAGEWKRLHIEELPYGKKLSDNEFTEAVSDFVAQGRNRQVRTYECVFSVMVWDRTPDHAKKRWKDAHDRIIEGSFSAYTVQDLEWTAVESWSADGNRVQSERVPH